MGERQNKSAILQWMVPLVIMVLVIIAMLINFSVKSSKRAKETINREMTEMAENYGKKFLDRLSGMEKTAKPIALLLERTGTADKARVAKLVEAVADSTDAYKVYYCDSDGNGIDQMGDDVYIGDSEYFRTIKESEEITYVYTEEGDYLGRKAFVVASRIQDGDEVGYLMLYYSADKFSEVLDKYDIGPATFLLLLDSEGKILASAGPNSPYTKGDNFIETVRAADTEAAKTISNRMRNSTRGTTEAVVDGDGRLIVYVPFGVKRWEIVLGVNQEYVDTQVAEQYKAAKDMLIQLCIVILVFVAAVVIINAVAKIRNNEKKKQLEDKADTDLLTGLNNKLATERKIKNYMAQNPDSQSMMFLFDIDNFKKINDTMGHAFGDEVLRSLGQQIGAIFRASDIVGRIGGDEFMVFLKGIDNAEIIRKEAKKVEDFFRSFQAGEYVKYAATASIGVAIFPQEGADFETLYKAADQGLYKAKKRGKNQLAFYKDEWAAGGTESKEQK